MQYISGVLRMNVDVTIMAQTTWDPYVYWNFSKYGPWSTGFNAESKYLATDIAVSHFGSMQVQRYDDTWTSSLPPMYNSCPWPQRYINNGISNNAFGLQTSGASSAFNC